MEERGVKAGDRLESERELSRILGISRPSLREAIQILQVQGRLIVKHGVGIFVFGRERRRAPSRFFTGWRTHDRRTFSNA